MKLQIDDKEADILAILLRHADKHQSLVFAEMDEQWPVFVRLRDKFQAAKKDQNRGLGLPAPLFRKGERVRQIGSNLYAIIGRRFRFKGRPDGQWYWEYEALFEGEEAARNFDPKIAKLRYMESLFEKVDPYTTAAVLDAAG